MTKRIIAVAACTVMVLLVVGEPGRTGRIFMSPSGVQIEVMVEGKGPFPRPGQTVIVHYTGMLRNGMKFDSSRDRGETFAFVLRANPPQVIQGWDEAAAMLKGGSKALLIIPPHLGYGAQGAGGVIPPNATLMFDIEILGAK